MVPVGLVVGAFVAIMTYEGYIHAEFAADGSVESDLGRSAVPEEILHGGPYIDTTTGQVASYQLPPKTVVLTFDDGPDPRWTPEILSVLDRHEVKATFFVVGTQVARYPTIAEAVVDAGHEVGVHTFTHPDMAALTPWLRGLEYSQTQMALAATVGQTTPLLRFPYSSGADSLDDVTWPLVLEAGRAGYVVVMSSLDSRDWERPGVDRIVAASMPADESPAVMLFHDAGGDRAQTVAALDIVIPMLKERGYQFLTAAEGLRASQALAGYPVSGGGPAPVDLVEATAAAIDVPVAADASASQIMRGRVLVLSVGFADGVFTWLCIAVIVTGGLLVVRTLLMFALAGRHARRRRSAAWSWGPPVTSPVSVVMPVFNERENIAAAVRSIAGGDYPEIEVVVVDDGSTDDTADIVAGLGLPNVRLVRIANGGKANALNVGVARARHDLVVMVDGDTVFERHSLRTLLQPFADPRVGGVSGNVKVSNRRGLIGQWQHIEYVIGFNLDRRLFEVMGCIPTIPGAIGGFRRQALADAGGVSDRTLAEDTDLTMAIVRAGWRVVYEDKAIAWTETPHSPGQLFRQRYRWAYGTMQAMWVHRRALRDGGPSGRFGRVGLPFIAAFSVIFPLLAPLVDILTVYGLVVNNRLGAGLAWLGMLVLQLVAALVAFRIDRESLRPLWTLPLQQLFYRQLLYLVLLRSTVMALAGVAQRWNKLHRTGAATAHLTATVTPGTGTGPVVDPSIGATAP